MRRSSQEPGPLHNGTSEDICDDRIVLPARSLPSRAGEAFAVTVIGRLKFQCLDRISEIVRKSSPLRDTLGAVPVTLQPPWPKRRGQPSTQRNSPLFSARATASGSGTLGDE